MSAQPASADTTPCPCGLPQPYPACCGRWLDTPTPADTPEALMRSRFTAYALGNTAYLVQTTHRAHPQYQKHTATWQRQLAHYCQTTQFSNLQVLGSGWLNDAHTDAWVHFRATLTLNGQASVLEEKSRFLRLGKRWLYHSAM